MGDTLLPRSGPGNSNISTNINHPTLRKDDAESIRVFLRKYDQYVTEIVERAAQYGDVDAAGTARPVQLNLALILNVSHLLLTSDLLTVSTPSRSLPIPFYGLIWKRKQKLLRKRSPFPPWIKW